MDNPLISSDIIRGYIDLMILRVLSEGDSYGYEVSKRITEISAHSYYMKETTLYSAFTRLEKQKYLHSYPGAYSGGRERTYFKLTEEGWAYFHQKCYEWLAVRTLIGKFIQQ